VPKEVDRGQTEEGDTERGMEKPIGAMKACQFRRGETTGPKHQSQSVADERHLFKTGHCHGNSETLEKEAGDTDCDHERQQCPDPRRCFQPLLLLQVTAINGHAQAQEKGNATQVEDCRGHQVKRPIEEVERCLLFEEHQRRTDEKDDETPKNEEMH